MTENRNIPDHDKKEKKQSPEPQGQPYEGQSPLEGPLLPNMPAPNSEKEPLKEPWQYNEDLKEKLAKVSPEFSHQTLKKDGLEKPADISAEHAVPVQQKYEAKILTSVSSRHFLDMQKLSHHSISLFILLGVVGFGLAALLFSVLSKPSLKKSASKLKEKPSVVEIINPVSVVEVKQEIAADEMAEQAQSNTVDSPIPSMNLSGIIFDKDDGDLALINGKIVREGHFIDGVKLEHVYPDKVEMSFENKKFILRSR